MPVVGKLKCLECDGTGRRWKKGKNHPTSYICPACNGTGMNQEAIITEDLSASGTNDMLRTLNIPAKYQEDFSGAKLTRLAPVAIPDRDESFNELIKFINSFLANLRVGKIPVKSFFVEAPHGFGKNYFVYTAMRNLAKAGKRPSRYWSLDDLDVAKASFDTLTSMKNAEGMDATEFEELLKIKEDLRKSDVLFVKVNPGIKKYTAWENLSWLLDYCNRNNKPLVVTANRPVNYYRFFEIYIQNQTERDDYGNLQNVTISKEMNSAYLSYFQVSKGLKEESVAEQKKNASHKQSSNPYIKD